MTARKTYSQEFKIEAVRLAKQRGFAQTRRDLGVNPNQIHNWRARLEQDGDRAFPGQGNPAMPNWHTCNATINASKKRSKS